MTSEYSNTEIVIAKCCQFGIPPYWWFLILRKCTIGNQSGVAVNRQHKCYEESFLQLTNPFTMLSDMAQLPNAQQVFDVISDIETEF